MKKKIVMFSGKTCGTCHSVRKQIKDRMENNNEHADFQEVSIDEGEGRKMAVKYCVSALPTAIIFENGRPVTTYIGSSLVQKLISDNLI